MQAVLHTALKFHEEAGEFLSSGNFSFGVEQILFVDRFDIRMRQMRWQDQFRFDQRKYQAQDDDNGHCLEERPDDAADEQHRGKRCDRR